AARTRHDHGARGRRRRFRPRPGRGLGTGARGGPARPSYHRRSRGIFDRDRLMAGWIAQPGLILFTENYDACVRFYRDVLDLPVLFDKGHLISLGFGSAYL